MMNIKSSLFYAALAACLGTGFAGGMVITQNDVDRAIEHRWKDAQCEETEDDKRFKSTNPMNSRGQGF